MRRTESKTTKWTWIAAAALLALAACGKVYEPEAEVRTFQIPVGTLLEVTPTEGYDLEELQANTPFAGVLASPLTVEGVVVAPEGSPVYGEAVVDAAAEGGYVPVGVTLTSMTIHGGDEAPISTVPIFPRPPENPAEDDEIAEDRVMTFVLSEPATFEWAMDTAMLEQ